MSRRLLKYMLFFGLLAGCSVATRQDRPVPAISGPIMTQAGFGVPSGPEPPSVKVSLSDGPGIAGLINNHYNETTSSCVEQGTGKERGLYFCTGVLVRTTDDGDFNPWEPSYTARILRGTSYSWIRHDLRTSTLYKRAGYILLNPADVLAQTVPGTYYPTFQDGNNTMVKCVYPFDAWTTRTMDRDQIGCDFEGTGLGSGFNNPWGSCERKLNYTSVGEWNDHFNSVGRVNYKQCSWGADNAQGWQNMIASHNAFSGQASWNEVMLHNNGPNPLPIFNEDMRQWIVAFFYDAAKSGALSDAQAFQRKMAATGKSVPILKLNFNAASNPFAYIASDQVAHP